MKVVFIDRDGVINKDKGYVYKVEDFEFVKDIFVSFKPLKSKGFNIIIVTNQSGIGRGYYKEDDFNIINNWMLNKFKEQGIPILDVFYCPHMPTDYCNCRKPKTGMFEQAHLKHNINKEQSWMIGDKESDITAALNFGITNTILIDNKDIKDKKQSDAKFILSSVNKINDYIV